MKGGELTFSDTFLEKEIPDFVKRYLKGHIAYIPGDKNITHYLQ